MVISQLEKVIQQMDERGCWRGATMPRAFQSRAAPQTLGFNHGAPRMGDQVIHG